MVVRTSLKYLNALEMENQDLKRFVDQQIQPIEMIGKP